ncbi:uncharacterized protein A1O9_00269 [Exophiala aquamarina CBS 119918]|uniref:Nucleoporin NSP1-like C-terminal domain-containing protein n=1 Tax=Exophiala aquamarina CBS 119918 TaxID=1182545 RepID=A0A072PRE8_9EURO|nr:uncharacterized protein A1O9_00269 [Exophiala aquamarina CBS 119918]KEF62297.1 hypothetical protein A1O9_00269 [Exophiala aquamarina CBS 119918]
MASPFNFGASASSSGASAPSLFGTSKPSGAGGSLFGNTGTSAPATGSTTGFSFGAPQQPSSTENKPASPSIFGSTDTASAGGFKFGQSKPDENKSGDAPKSLFAGFGTPDKSSTPTTSAPSLFGSTTPATSSAGGLFSFGNPSTTPAGPPPSTTAFGASTGGAGLFAPKPAQESSQSPSFSFGKPPATDAPSKAPAQPAGIFGSKPAGSPFSFGPPSKPSDNSTTSAANTSAPQSKPTLSFGGAASSTASSSTPLAPAASQPTSSTPLFGAQPPAQNGSGLSSKPSAPEIGGATKPSPFAPTPTQTSGATAPAASGTGQKPLFGGFNLGGTGSNPAATTTAPTTTTTSSASPFSFPATAAPSSSQPASQAPATGGFSFGPKPTASTSQPAASTSTSAPLFSLGANTSTSTTQPATTAAATASTASSAPPIGTGAIGAQTSTAGPAPPAQSRLRNKTMDEILTRWATDMSRYSKEFKDHAETIARWDQIIVDNSSKIDKLYVRTRTCERQTMSVDMQLSAIENQQAELESWLTKYENDVDEILAKESGNPSELGGPDQERERTYKLAEKLGERLEEMERDLASMVEEVNAANTSLSKNGKADEPITQIVKILNSHLIQLQAIDQGTAALQEKVAAAQKSANSLGYLNGSTDGSGGAAVQDFYRSYMGRR